MYITLRNQQYHHARRHFRRPLSPTGIHPSHEDSRNPNEPNGTHKNVLNPHQNITRKQTEHSGSQRNSLRSSQWRLYLCQILLDNQRTLRKPTRPTETTWELKPNQSNGTHRIQLNPHQTNTRKQTEPTGVTHYPIAGAPGFGSAMAVCPLIHSLTWI